MNSNTELEDYTRQLHIPLRFIKNKDKLNEMPLQNGAYIVNLQDDYRADGVDLTGTHWVAFWIENGKAVYFNSFGLPPPAEVQLFLYKFRPYSYNHNQIQNTMSGWCGIYVLAFLHYMNTHKKIPLPLRFQKFLDLFSDNVRDNLTILKKIMGKHFFK